MKKTILALLLLFSAFGFSQKKKITDLYKRGEYNRAIELANSILESAPEDLEVNLMLLKINNLKSDYKSAEIVLKKLKKSTIDGSNKTEFLAESLKTNYGLGNIETAKNIYNELRKNPENTVLSNELTNFGLITGLDKIYDNWKTKESNNLIFHFQSSISEDNMEHIASSRQKAFEEINLFFNSKLPKKIDFFVWDTKDNFNPYLKTTLGFTVATFCVSHNRINQSSGHEITHSISFWKNPENTTTKFINEGIAVCFDLQKNDKLEIAKQVYKKTPIDIKQTWKNQIKLDDNILYPISGAFVEYLIKYDKNKFLQLLENQTYESAKKIYAGEIDKLIDQFYIQLEE